MTVPDDVDQIILEQLERLEDAEEERHKRADSKLSSMLVVIPLTVTLASSVVIGGAKDALTRSGGLGRLIEILIIAAVVAFLVGARDAVRGLDPIRARYHHHNYDAIVAYQSQDAVSLRRYLVEELHRMLPKNEEINSRKFTDYRRAYYKVMLGTILLTLALMLAISADLLGRR
jgi:hypothetical protein